MHCLTCRGEVQPEDKRCPSCRARTQPLFIRPFVYVVVLSALFAGLFIGWKKLNTEAQARGAFEVQKDSLPGAPKKHRTLQVPLVPTLAPGAAPAASTTTAVPEVAQPLVPISAEATSVAEPAQNGCGQSVSYDAAQLLDGDPSTAWRAVGGGKGIKITLTLKAAKRITEVGLIPGYDKTDQCTGIDRFVQMRRIKRVRWSFDDNTSIEQTFTDERSSQAIAVTAVSTHIFLEILETTTQRELDYTAISDVRVAGTAA